MNGESAGGVYGLLIALSVASAAAFQEVPGAGIVAIAVAASGLVFWVAHVHAGLVAMWVRGAERPTRAQIRAHALNELPIFLACVPAVTVLLLSAVGLYSVSTALWIVAGVSIALLAAWGLAIGRTARVGLAGGLLVAGINVAMGLVIVALKVIFTSH